MASNQRKNRRAKAQQSQQAQKQHHQKVENERALMGEISEYVHNSEEMKKFTAGMGDKVDNNLREGLLGYNFLGDGSQVSQSATLFKNARWYLVSNFRQLLSEIYVEYGLVQTIVDVPVEDALRGGVEILTDELDEEDIEDLITSMEEEDDFQTISQAMKWTRLFGGGAIIVISNQDPLTPLEIDSFEQDEPMSLRAIDMWELYDGAYTMDGDEQGLKLEEGTDFYNYYGNKIHKSRVFRMKGKNAPSFVRPRLRGWGLSIMEALVRSINQYLKATDLSFEVLDEFKIDIFKIKGLTQTLATKDGIAKVQQRVQLANQQKNYQSAITMDGEDDYQQKQLTFAGLSEAMDGIRKQVASDMRMPMTKLFGVSSAGFSSGEDDIENYNAMVESDVRAKAKFHILRIIKLRCAQKFGFVPEDLKIEFKPLRILTSEQEQNVKTQKFNRLLQSRQAGEITSQEFKEACNKENLFPIKVDDTSDSLESTVGKGSDGGGKGVKPIATGGGSRGSKPTSPTSAPPAPVAKTSNENERESVRIAVMAVMSEDGYMLCGKRRDNGKWTCPGGHLEIDEAALAGAYRECEEECGISKDQFTRVESIGAKKFKSLNKENTNVQLFPYIGYVKNKVMPQTILDGDEEVSEWKWVSTTDTTAPELQRENRHAKNDVILDALGL